MEKENLHLLINEEIYLIRDKTEVEEVTKEPIAAEALQAKEPEAIKLDPPEIDHEHHEETPHIPEVKTLQEKTEKAIPFAVFHESSDPAEIDLLQKIIAACNLENTHFKVFANGFNKEVKFEKALVFVTTAKAYYTPVPYQQSQFLCSQPLSVLLSDQQVKAKLWTALKAFLKV